MAHIVHMRHAQGRYPGAVPSGNNPNASFSGSKMREDREAIAMRDTKTKCLPYKYRRPDGGGDAA
jgi:hypothetical protein